VKQNLPVEARIRNPGQALKILWQFSRPHTIIGSTLSILSIFAVAVGTSSAVTIASKLLPLSLLSALACNVYITGLNQWSDIAVDKINKPWLPIAAGTLSKQNAMRIVVACGIVSLAAAAYLSWPFFGLIVSIISIGTAYSLPPLKLKRNHLLAAAAISIVRGLLVNIGFYMHFRYEIMGEWTLPMAIIPLTVFVTGFSLGIAWFKDIPDTKGDAVYKFGTLAVKSGRQKAFILGVIVVSLAYVYIIFAALMGQLPAMFYYIITHSAALSLFLFQASALQVSDDQQVKRFYLFFWGLFFLEYLIYPIGFYLPC
jgi:homogentisate phytyltransferase / homogentisate geranylgeranyltransferase